MARFKLKAFDIGHICRLALVRFLPPTNRHGLSRCGESKEVELEDNVKETLRLTCSLMLLNEQVMLLLSSARQSLQVIVNTLSNRWAVLPSVGNMFMVLDSSAFKVMKVNGKVTTGHSWEVISGILVFTAESGGFGLTVSTRPVPKP